LELIYKTGLSRHEQHAACTVLKARGLLEERYDRLDHQLYLRVQVAAYNAMILAMHEAASLEDPLKAWEINLIRKSDMAMYMNGLSGDPKIEHGEIRHADIASTESREYVREGAMARAETGLGGVSAPLTNVWHSPPACSDSPVYAPAKRATASGTSGPGAMRV
jgi:hypothetical protein